jgi:hypothetical protein
MQTISTEDLGLVNGGTPSATQGPATSGGGSSLTASGCSDALASSLHSIKDTLKDLKNGANNSNQGLFGGQNGLLFAMLALQHRQQNTVVVGGRGGYYWQSSW